MQNPLETRANALENAFQGEDCNQARAIRNIIDAGLVDGRNKKTALKVLERLTDQVICYAFNQLTGVSRNLKLALVDNGQAYRLLKYNTAFL
ncbi:MAG: hypothetical protein ABIB47_02665 [Candidatus Woesearchaeota archaeon]